MSNELKLFWILICIPITSYSQLTQERDSLKAISLTEVVVIGENTNSVETKSKLLGNIDEYLSHSSKVNLIKRGAYAWEPTINNMATERTSVTIDGMHIFGACTDKMDPITSYLETNNLSEIQISSGQEGNANGATIGGSINLVRKRTYCGCSNPWSTTLFSGFETNGKQRIVMGHTGYSAERFYTDVSASFRKADAYKDGNGTILKYSQFQKYNISAIVGTKISEDGLLEGDIIYDKATDVGYPALPMDVSLAEAAIGSLSYTLSPKNKWFSQWKTKIYFNTITHIMDDTTRPEVPVHMDMPGWSTTYGGFSQLSTKVKKHALEAQITAYNNLSVAEMTMYPKDKMEALMFMYTWPQVHTTYVGLSASDKFYINHHLFSIKTAIGTNYSFVGKSDLYSFPDMEKGRTRILPSLSMHWKTFHQNLETSFGVGYGHRAPSVSEAYGFFLFNSFDGYDYMGNPNLKNEISYETNMELIFHKNNWKTRWNATYFLVQNYIIGKIIKGISAMTYGANGVRKYEGLPHSSIFNTEFELNYQFNSNWFWKTNFKYAIGKDNEGNPLPLIQPFTYQNSIYFNSDKWNIELATKGSFEHSNFSEEYGEDATPAYTIFDVNGSYLWLFNDTSMTFQLGIENIFNKYYSTYSDWNNIPRKGRNFFMGVQYAF